MIDKLIEKWEKRLVYELQILSSMERIASRESIKDQQYEVEMIKSFILDLQVLQKEQNNILNLFTEDYDKIHNA